MRDGIGHSTARARPPAGLAGRAQPHANQDTHLADAGRRLRHLRAVLAAALLAPAAAAAGRARQHLGGRAGETEALRAAAGAVAGRRQQLRQPVRLLLLQSRVSTQRSPGGATAHLLHRCAAAVMRFRPAAFPEPERR